MADAHPVLAVRIALLILDEEISDSLVLGEEGFGNHTTRMRRVVDRSVAEFSFSLRMNPVTHAILARMRASASSPGIIATLPDRISS